MSNTADHATPKVYIQLRVDVETRDRVRELADQECEGNQSMMIRRLVIEALNARVTK